MKEIKIIPIASGSTGNSMYIDVGGYKLLVDMGVSLKKTKEALAFNSIDFKQIDAAFLTHNHSDHIGGLPMISKCLNKPIYATVQTASTLNNSSIKGIEYDDRVEVLKDLYVTAFYTSHDAYGSCGFIFEYEDTKIGYATDLGVINEDVIDYLKESDLVVLESNHDIDMLKKGRYPYILKRRILSDSGHLANVSCAKAIKELSDYGTKNFMLAHLSRENNRPEIALNETLKMVDKDVNVFVLPMYGQEMITVK